MYVLFIVFISNLKKQKQACTCLWGYMSENITTRCIMPMKSQGVDFLIYGFVIFLILLYFLEYVVMIILYCDSNIFFEFEVWSHTHPFPQGSVVHQCWRRSRLQLNIVTEVVSRASISFSTWKWNTIQVKGSSHPSNLLFNLLAR